MDRPCEKMQDRLADYILGILSAEEINTINEHISWCPKCRQYVQELEDENRILVQFGEDLKATMAARQDKVIEAISRSEPTVHRKTPSLWRIIMKSNMTKLATAAVIIVAVVLTVTILDRTVTPAWAIEDTVKALNQFNGIYLSGVVGVPIDKIGRGEDLVLRDGKNMSVEFWMQANEERTRSENYRIEGGDGTVWSVCNSMTYRYDPKNNTVRVQSGRGIEMSIWPCGDYLLKLQEFMKDWQVMYGKDAVTGRDCAFITLSNPSQGQSWWLEIDLETNLPVRAKGWHNTRREGTPSMNFERIVFSEKLPDDIFEFQIPEGATVIEE